MTNDQNNQDNNLGAFNDNPGKRQPWWTNPTYEIHLLEITKDATSKLYCRFSDDAFEYAYVQWRSGTAYLFGLYRDGKNVTPIDMPVVTKQEFKKNRWRVV